MVGSGEEIESIDLGNGRTLVLNFNWESDEGLLEAASHISGKLPGEGVSAYTIVIRKEGKERDHESILEEFNFEEEAISIQRTFPQRWKTPSTSGKSTSKAKSQCDCTFKRDHSGSQVKTSNCAQLRPFPPMSDTI